MEETVGWTYLAPAPDPAMGEKVDWTSRAPVMEERVSWTSLASATEETDDWSFWTAGEKVSQSVENQQLDSFLNFQK